MIHFNPKKILTNILSLWDNFTQCVVWLSRKIKWLNPFNHFNSSKSESTANKTDTVSKEVFNDLNNNHSSRSLKEEDKTEVTTIETLINIPSIDITKNPLSELLKLTEYLNTHSIEEGANLVIPSEFLTLKVKYSQELENLDPMHHDTDKIKYIKTIDFIKDTICFFQKISKGTYFSYNFKYDKGMNEKQDIEVDDNGNCFYDSIYTLLKLNGITNYKNHKNAVCTFLQNNNEIVSEKEIRGIIIDELKNRYPTNDTLKNYISSSISDYKEDRMKESIENMATYSVLKTEEPTNPEWAKRYCEYENQYSTYQNLSETDYEWYIERAKEDRFFANLAESFTFSLMIERPLHIMISYKEESVGEVDLGKDLFASTPLELRYVDGNHFQPHIPKLNLQNFPPTMES